MEHTQRRISGTVNVETQVPAQTDLSHVPRFESFGPTISLGNHSVMALGSRDHSPLVWAIEGAHGRRVPGTETPLEVGHFQPPFHDRSSCFRLEHNCRTGFALTGKRHLRTAHAKIRPSWSGSVDKSDSSVEVDLHHPQRRIFAYNLMMTIM